jgi:hypothetical protein
MGNSCSELISGDLRETDIKYMERSILQWRNHLEMMENMQQQEGMFNYKPKSIKVGRGEDRSCSQPLSRHTRLYPYNEKYIPSKHN